MTHPNEFNVFFIGDPDRRTGRAFRPDDGHSRLGDGDDHADGAVFDNWLHARGLHRYGIATLILASLMIVTVHYLEVAVWRPSSR